MKKKMEQKLLCAYKGIRKKNAIVVSRFLSDSRKSKFGLLYIMYINR